MMYIAAGLIQAKMQCRQPIQQKGPVGGHTVFIII